MTKNPLFFGFDRCKLEYVDFGVFPSEVLDLAGIANPKLEIDVTNYKGIRSKRIIKPLRRAMWFGSTPYHTEPQWFMRVWDLSKNEERDFAWNSIHSIRVIKDDEEPISTPTST